MKNNILILLLLITLFLGISMGLIPMYAPYDEEPVSPLKGSFFYSSFAGVIIILNLFTINKSEGIKKWILISLNSIYGIFGILLFLISVYAPPMNDGSIDALGGALFFSGAMMVLSSMFFIRWK